MEAVELGSQEIRDNLATYLLETTTPVAIMRDGETVGYYMPASRTPTDAEIAGLRQVRETAMQWQAELNRAGVTEDDALSEFKLWRRSQPR